MAAEPNLMERLTALCKRRGFIFPGSEIYGGLGGFWDYGPLGVELKRNVKDLWWRDMVTNPPTGPDGKEISMQGIDAALIMNPKVWEASGHVGGFADLMVDCRKCKSRFRADKVFQVLVLDETTSERIKAYSAVAEAFGDEPHIQVKAIMVAATEADSMSQAVRQAILAVEQKAKASGAAKFKKCTLEYDDDPGVLADIIGVQLQSGEVLGAFVWPQTHTKGPMGHTCPRCFESDALTEPRAFNLMFETHVGAVRDASSKAYLRPETAQGIFVNFHNVLDTMRVKIPFGIGQVGKAFRNEINPRNYTFRSREFEQMEIEFFCHPDTAMDWYDFWRKVRYDWYVNLGLKSEKLRLRDQDGDELAHYSKCCADIEYLFPFSDEFQELEGVAHRGNYDLTQHQKHSGKDLTYFDDDLWQQDAHKYAGDKDAAKKAKQDLPYRYLPTVIEPSAGVDRTALAFLCEAYCEDEAPNDKGQMDKRVVMKFHPKIAPIKAAFFPLVNKEGMPEIAEQLYRDAKQHLNVFFDVKGAIGRRYRRQDEAGTPFCITVDGQTLEDGTVTIRDRDTLEQVRVGKDHVTAWLRERLM